MPPINLASKQQDLLRAYLQVSKTEKPDWNAIAAKADYDTAKYARDTWAAVKKKLLATSKGDVIDLPNRQAVLLSAALEIMKNDTDWDKVAKAAGFTTSKYARDTWANVKSKLIGTKPTKERKSGVPAASHKRKAVDDEDDQAPSADSVEEAPAKKAKKTSREAKAKVKVQETEAKQNDEEGGGNERSSITPEPITFEKSSTGRRSATDMKAKDAEAEAAGMTTPCLQEQTKDDETNTVNDAKTSMQDLADGQIKLELLNAADEAAASCEDMALVF